MSNFPGEYNTLDTFAFRAAVEAVISVILRGGQANDETVRAWLETAVDAEIPNRQVRGRAMYFARRMFDGPFRPDGP
jgi:hypothetical protein